jgi:hypothetical protein
MTELNINETDIQILKKSNDEFKESVKFFIISYDLCWRIEKKIIAKNFKFAEIMAPILTKCKRLLFLSGTPILSKPIEIFNLIKCLRPDIFKSLSAFGTRYCNQKQSKL